MDLPAEIVYAIINYCDVRSIYRLMHVSSRLREIIKCHLDFDNLEMALIRELRPDEFVNRLSCDILEVAHTISACNKYTQIHPATSTRARYFHLFEEMTEEHILNYRDVDASISNMDLINVMRSASYVQFARELKRLQSKR
jgi:hypothetical protein